MSVVRLVDLSRRAAHLSKEFLDAAADVLESGQLLLGPRLDAFEKAFATFTGQAHAVGVSSGASALQLALRAVGVGPGDEVIIPDFTAVPTASAVCALGAVPVPVDVDEATATLDPHAAAAARTSRTRAVVPVHLYGRPADVEGLVPLGIPIVEDAAQAHGALRPVRSSAAVCYSFYPTKNLGGVGDGGAVVTDDTALAETVRQLRAHGSIELYVHTAIAQNFRMSELEAVWLQLGLRDLAAGNARRRTIAAAYRSHAPALRWAEDHPDHVYHQCVVRAHDRERFRAALTDAGVATGVHYPRPVSGQPAYRQFLRQPCPHSAAWAAECVSVPCFPELTDVEIDQVATALAKVSSLRHW
jgi:dTDP-4-amino-4,6-dideoxygalactose transaminase